MAQWNLQTVHRDVEKFCKSLRKKKRFNRRCRWLMSIIGILSLAKNSSTKIASPLAKVIH